VATEATKITAEKTEEKKTEEQKEEQKEQADQTDQIQASESYFEETYLPKIAKTLERGDRSDGLRIVLGQDMIDKLAHANLFMIGAGAIGCELLKNYAMLGVGCGKKDAKAGIKGGTIVLTDPDVIEEAT